MQESEGTPLGTLRPRTRCPRCGDLLEWSEEHSVLLGCSCCTTVDEALQKVARGLAGRMKEKSHWASGRVGDINFVGATKTRGKFVRVRSDTDPVLIYQMLMEWGLAPPHLVVALVGGDEMTQMKPWLRDILRKGLVKAAQSTGAWILTNGLRFGITKHLGQAVRDHSLASTSSKVRVVAIGIAPWNMIHNREALASNYPKVEEPAVYEPQDLPHGSVYSLDSNHSHFVLVEEDPDRPGATSEMRVKLLKHISLQRTGYGGAGSFEIPVLCFLVHGEPKILKRMHKGIGNSTPWLILAGSGGVADMLVTLMNRGCWDEDAVRELLLDTFPNAHHGTDVRNWVKLIQRILDHGHLLTVHDPEQESSELDTVILKALVKACKSQSQEAQDFLDELKLAVAWNRVDIAKSDIFNGDVEWKACDLEEVMMDALINDKPDFVRLFVDNGVNLGEFLTYGRLQELYWSVSEKSLFHNLLLKKYEEKQLLLGAGRTPGPPGHHPPEGDRKPRFTLFEVAKVLKDFLHDSCKGFYQRVPTEKPAKGRLFHTQKNMAESEERCEHPWRDLFLWAVLQNRQQMANYFWAMGPEAVAAALAGCKILKEMARLESEAESARSMKEAKYEQFALDVFGECYSNSEDRAYALLVRRTHCWSKSTVLNLATEADAKAFFAHDGVQSFFTDEEMSILKKFKLYVEDNWNKCDMVAILLFVVGVSCRMAEDTYEAGRTVLAIDFMVFTLRLIHIFAIHKQLGPKIIIVERMMKDVFFFLFFLSVWMIAYGVATQALLHPNDPRIDWVFRRALYRPYLHIFGQIPLEEIDAARMPEINCTNDSEEIILGLRPPCPNIYANWLVILLLVIFLLVTNVLLLNLLIAMFSYTFQVVQGNADIFWKFQRYNLIVEYHSRPALAPPFIIISHLSQLLLSLVKKPASKHEHLERELPEGLDQRLITWETVQKENYLAKLEHQHWESSEERLKSTSSKVQSLLKIVSGFKDQDKRLVSMDAQVRYCGEVLSWMAECFAQSTLKCGKDAPRAPMSLSGTKDAPESPPEKKVQSEEKAAARPGHQGYGAKKKLPYIDE
uniref:transient receptor potential cation channel subfamily M member 5 isoform X2 n=1 Tax=Gasterosteus aculeatus aculeatus TaxID=481459 RepID=UPI001A980196|nr:transient receptor potential cation channel subfamily M member 5 isoform X2 [Gasterosteus aculeatus aculeatus]